MTQPSLADIDQLIQTAVFTQDATKKLEARMAIEHSAKEKGITLSSTNQIYQAFGEGLLKGFTVPALNIRTLTYDTARVVFRLMMTHKIGIVIFEIARSEMGYTEQTPEEYKTAILAAAIKETYQGPVFIQGDHFQLNAKNYAQNKESEIKAVKELAREAIKAGFFNIDIDASTLVDLKKESLIEQQRPNFEVTADITAYIRTLPSEKHVAIGGEIGHIGGKNSTVEEFRAFMQGFTSLVPENGISKVSVQTGSSHGGIPLADGSIAKVSIDFSVLREIGNVARSEFGLGGAVQHGASTLPLELFEEFPKAGTLEIHLATGFQNTVFETLPKALIEEMYAWVEKEKSSEKESDQTNEQFIYKTRKKALGPFKKQLWNLREDEKRPILAALETKLLTIFESLQIRNTKELIKPYVT